MNRPICLFAVSLAFAGALLTSVPASAQPPPVPPPPAPPAGAPPAPAAVPPAPPAAPAEAAPAGIDADVLIKQRAAFARANDLYDKGRLQEAEAIYLEAWKLKRSHDVAGNLGLLEADLNKPRAAAEYLAFALREFPAGGAPAKRDALLRKLAEMQNRIGTLRIQVNKPGAEVFIDNVSIGYAPVAPEVFVEPGAHVVEARFEGRVVQHPDAGVEKGASKDIVLTVGGAPARKAIIYSGIGLTAAGIIAGGVFLGLSASKSGTITDLRTSIGSAGCGDPNKPSTASPSCKSLQGALYDRATFGNVGFWSLVGAGAVGVGTVVYAYSTRTRSPEAPAKVGLRILPLVSPEGGGAMLTGAF